MRYMIMHKMTPAMEAGTPPSPEDMERIGAFIQQVAATGKLVDAAGLGPTKGASRVTIKNGRTSVVDGPFAETKELIAGYGIFEVESHEEAVEWARKFAEVHGGDLEIDVRRVLGPDDVA